MENATSTLQDADGMVSIASSSDGGDDRWVIIVDVVMLVLTVLGATSILANMLYNERILHRAATVRMRLVQALVLSDLLLGISALVPSIAKLKQDVVLHGSSFCDGFGFVLVAAVWGEHCWTLVLAVATYMILCHPLHAVTRALDKRWIWLYLVVWGFCIGIAVLGYELYGYFPSGGICYYGTNAGLYSELIQFIPRGIVFVFVIVIYSKLHTFLKRPDRIKGSFSKSNPNTLDKTGQTSTGEYEVGAIAMHGDGHGRVTRQRGDAAGGGRSMLPSREKLWTGFRKFSFGHAAGRPQDDAGAGGVDEREKVATEMGQMGGKEKDGFVGGALARQAREDSSGSTPSASDVTRASDPVPVTSAIPPWERLELPAFQIGNQRYGGSPANVRDTQSHFMGWKGMGMGMGKSGKVTGGRPNRSGSGATTPDVTVQSRSSSIHRPHSSIPAAGAARRDRRRTNELELQSTNGRPSTPTSPLIGLAPRSSVAGQGQTRSPMGPDESGEWTSPDSLVDPTTISNAPNGSPDEPRASAPGNRSRQAPGSINLPTTYRHSIVSPYPSPLGTTMIAPGLSYPTEAVPGLSASGSVSTYHTGSIPSVADTFLHGGTRDVQLRRDSAVSGSDTEYARRGSGPVTFILPLSKFQDLVSEKRRGSYNPTSSSRRSSVDDGATSSLPNPVGRRPLNDVEDQRGSPGQNDHVDGDDPGAESDEEMDLARMLADSYDDDYQPGSFSRRRVSDESEDWQQESMASYLNRKTAMLMLYFPIAYVALFSVSLVRLIYDFSTTRKEPLALTAISRWLVFAQGLVDAVIYGWIEYRTKRAVRRKIRSGQMSPGGLNGGGGGNSRTGSRGSIVGMSEAFKVSVGGMRRSRGGGTGTAAQMESEEATFRGNDSVSKGGNEMTI